MKMKATDIYEKLWHAPNGHVYYGEFSDEYKDHLFDITTLITIFYCDSIPGEVPEELNQLVVSYFLEATREVKPCTPTEEMNKTASPVAWLADRIKDCIIFDGALIDDYKKAMGLPIESMNDSYARYRTMNNIDE